jgi:hypothetical protein
MNALMLSQGTSSGAGGTAGRGVGDGARQEKRRAAIVTMEKGRAARARRGWDTVMEIPAFISHHVESFKSP